jgi:hypothetical protein
MRHHRAAAHGQEPKIYASNARNVEEEKKHKGVVGSALHLNTRLLMICWHVWLLIMGLVLQGMSIINNLRYP